MKRMRASTSPLLEPFPTYEKSAAEDFESIYAKLWITSKNESRLVGYQKQIDVEVFQNHTGIFLGDKLILLA